MDHFMIDRDHAGYGGIFRDSNAKFVGAFSGKAEVNGAIDVEIRAVIEAINIACARSWFPLWIETDSMLLLHYFKYPHTVPWRLRPLWHNCMRRIRQLQVHVSHIYREGNRVADKLANHGAMNVGAEWWDLLPSFLNAAFGHDYSGFKAYRFS